MTHKIFLSKVPKRHPGSLKWWQGMLPHSLVFFLCPKIWLFQKNVFGDSAQIPLFKKKLLWPQYSQAGTHNSLSWASSLYFYLPACLLSVQPVSAWVGVSLPYRPDVISLVLITHLRTNKGSERWYRDKSTFLTNSCYNWDPFSNLSTLYGPQVLPRVISEQRARYRAFEHCWMQTSPPKKMTHKT